MLPFRHTAIPTSLTLTLTQTPTPNVNPYPHADNWKSISEWWDVGMAGGYPLGVLLDHWMKTLHQEKPFHPTRLLIIYYSPTRPQEITSDHIRSIDWKGEVAKLHHGVPLTTLWCFVARCNFLGSGWDNSIMSWMQPYLEIWLYISECLYF